MRYRQRLCCEFFQLTRFRCRWRLQHWGTRPVCDAFPHQTGCPSKWHHLASGWCFCNENMEKTNENRWIDSAGGLFDTYCDKRWMMSSMRKMSSFVLPLCFKTPFTLQLTFKLCGSATALLWTMAGPKGQNVSIDFPMRNWPPLRCFCQSRAEISWATL